MRKDLGLELIDGAKLTVGRIGSSLGFTDGISTMSIAVSKSPKAKRFIGHKAYKSNNPTRGFVFVVVLLGVTKLEV